MNIMYLEYNYLNNNCDICVISSQIKDDERKRGMAEDGTRIGKGTMRHRART